MKRLILIIMILVVIGSFIYLGFYFSNITGEVVFDDAESFGDKGFVTRVIDGDTVVIKGESVRLLGIDSDERGYDCYNEAKKRMEELVLNKEIRLEKDKRDKDQYRRYLRYLFVEIGEEEINVNLQMVKEGMAIARFYEDKKYKNEILKAEIESREDERGCKWSGIN
ncbi:hypothetical protein CMI42_05520 [Candidatus Pacearchaeota archaeon]|nr:hypothetical protein [Candidatus Pacearchaeota archaeon]